MLETAPDRQPAVIAPWPHTLAVLGVLVLLAGSSYLRAHTLPSNAPYTLRAFSSVIWQLLLLGAVVAGVYRRGVFFDAALLQRSRPLSSEIAYASIVYVAGLGIIVLCSLVLHPLHLAHPDRTMLQAMMPHTTLQFLPWFAVSLAAGFCEELVFRGYLLQQATALTRSTNLAVAATSILFGLMHLYEGPTAVVSLCALAVLYALVTLRRGNLVAAILAHTLQDFLAAILFLTHPR